MTLKSFLLPVSTEKSIENLMNDCRKNDNHLLYRTVVIPFNSLSSGSRNTELFAHSDFKIAPSCSDKQILKNFVVLIKPKWTVWSYWHHETQLCRPILFGKSNVINLGEGLKNSKTSPLTQVRPPVFLFHPLLRCFRQFRTPTQTTCLLP